MKKFVSDLIEEFHRLLQRKTSWGKDEVYVLFLEAITNVISNQLGFGE